MIPDKEFEYKMIKKYKMDELEAEIYQERMAIILEDEHIRLIDAHQFALIEVMERRKERRF